MSYQSDVKRFLQRNSSEAGMAFHDEIATDENKDYRRGFRAGVYFAFLQMESDIGNLENALTERTTD